MNWLADTPTEHGDYLWVAMWSCECGCIRSFGICFIDETGIHYSGPPPTYLDAEKTKPDVDGWLRLDDLPAQKE